MRSPSRDQSPPLPPLSLYPGGGRLRLRPGYANLEFLITTGPGPVPSLDGENVVFGRVIEGLGTLSALADVPTFYPPERSRMLNNVAKVIGDDRAAKAQSNWGRPLKPVRRFSLSPSAASTHRLALASRQCSLTIFAYSNPSELQIAAREWSSNTFPFYDFVRRSINLDRPHGGLR